MLEENPPLPEEQMAEEEKAKKIRAVMEEEIQLGNEKVEEMIVEAPKVAQEETTQKQKELQKHELFEGYDKIEEEEEKPALELNLPDIQHLEIDKEEEERQAAIIKELSALIPQNKQDLWNFQINWEKLSKTVVIERNIRPWL